MDVGGWQLKKFATPGVVLAVPNGGDDILLRLQVRAAARLNHDGLVNYI